MVGTTQGSHLITWAWILIQDGVRTYINMSSYITTILERLELPDNYGCYYIPSHGRDTTKKHRTYHKPVKVPMRDAIDGDNSPLHTFTISTNQVSRHDGVHRMVCNHSMR